MLFFSPGRKGRKDKERIHWAIRKGNISYPFLFLAGSKGTVADFLLGSREG